MISWSDIGKACVAGALTVSSYAYGTQVKIDDLTKAMQVVNLSIAKLTYSYDQLNMRMSDYDKQSLNTKVAM